MNQIPSYSHTQLEFCNSHNLLQYVKNVSAKGCALQRH
jgi:hypothetical protein